MARAYKDANGVTWTINVSNSGRSMFATVLDDAEPRYIPPAEDQQHIIVTPENDTPEAQTEVERVALIAIREQIDAFSLAHKTGVGLSVTASAGIPWWVWVAAGYLLLTRRRH